MNSRNDENAKEASSQEKHTVDNATTVDLGPGQHEYITGAKLFLVIASVTLIAFLMMLDMTVIVTVRYHSLV